MMGECLDSFVVFVRKEQKKGGRPNERTDTFGAPQEPRKKMKRNSLMLRDLSSVSSFCVCFRLWAGWIVFLSLSMYNKSSPHTHIVVVPNPSLCFI